jgi:hypothetical protein
MLAAVAPGALAAEPREVLAERLLPASSHAEQARILLEVAYLDTEEDPAVVVLARERLPEYEAAVLRPLVQAFPTAPAEARLPLMELAGRLYPDLKGVNPDYRKILLYGFECEEAAVRHEAIGQTGRYRQDRLAINVADLYFLHPEDRLPALEALALLGSRSGISAGLDALESDEPALREGGIRTLAGIGRPSALPLKERMIGDDPRLARDALRALLGFAEAQDLSALHEYAERHAAGDEEMGRLLTRAIAQLEVGTYLPPEPENL